MERAYSTLRTKGIDAEQRVIHGLASGPNIDHLGDSIDPAGAVFKLPMPFLRSHDSNEPIGHVIGATVSPAGIEIDVQLQRVERDNPLWSRLEGAWTEIRLGLMKGLSIGFRSLEREPMNGGGYRYKRWNWLETSAVVCPANADASITMIRSIAQKSQVIRAEPPRRRGVVYLKPYSLRGRDGAVHSVRIMR